MAIALPPLVSFALCAAFWRCAAHPRPFWPWFWQWGVIPWAILTAFWWWRWG